MRQAPLSSETGSHTIEQMKKSRPLDCLAFALLMTSLVWVTKARAEDSNTDFSVFLGYLLPNQIPSVTNNLPLFGGRYSFVYPWGAIESELENSHAQGVDWTQGSVSIRGDSQFAPGIDMMVYGGPDIVYYIPNGATMRQFDYGVHLGVAVVVQLKDSLWLRADLKFLGNPGTALYLMGGLMFRPGGSSSP